LPIFWAIPVVEMVAGGTVFGVLVKKQQKIVSYEMRFVKRAYFIRHAPHFIRHGFV
jgi:hypothetical protein